MSIEIESTKKTAVSNPDMDLLKSRMTQGNEHERNLLTFLFDYDKAMNTKKELGTVGLEWQVKLYQYYYDIIERVPQKEFRQLWSIVLLFAKLHKETTFNALMINRFQNLWVLGDAKLTTFQMLNNLVLLTADPEKRALNIRRQIDLGKALDKHLSPDGAQRLVSYYNQ